MKSFVLALLWALGYGQLVDGVRALRYRFREICGYHFEYRVSYRIPQSANAVNSQTVTDNREEPKQQKEMACESI